jgi:hypothetical protein
VLQFLKQSGITETPLSVEHVESLLNVLVLDGEIERVIQSTLHRELPLLNPFTRFLRTAPLSGIPRPSRTTHSLSPNVIPKPNENTGLAMMARAVRKARAQSDRIATRSLMMLLPRHGKGEVASRNAKTAILIADQNENDENPKPAMTTVAKTRRKTGRRNGRTGPGQRNRRAESNLKTNPLPLRPTLVPNPTDSPGMNDPDVPNQNQSRTPRNPLNDHPPPHHSRNTIMSV